MQLFGWTLHSCWMLLTVISVCCCVDIGSSTDINEEVMEEQPWIWNDFKLAGVARKLHSILDNGVSEEDNDNMAAVNDDRVASRVALQQPATPIFATVSNFREKQQQEPHQPKQHRTELMAADSPYEDDVYDVESDQLVDDESGQYYGKPTSEMKRSKSSYNPSSEKHRPKQQRNSKAPLSSPLSSTESDEVLASPSSAISRDSAEPRVLPLLGFHTAINKINRQKEALLKKILRQAARRQSMKRSPNCMRKCIAQGLLHPAQCHSLC
ncbi:uncharacterized protein LOC130696837 [Daphnia carinata]|uniref:uncharacterized protein LOC130696837 n=1 Tax=Daphnia carinata TaxID=120202 RepID=UPI00257A0331|nr:uncharacterized protein LOC130696837 [Daphnia carinata]